MPPKHSFTSPRVLYELSVTHDDSDPDQKRERQVSFQEMAEDRPCGPVDEPNADAPEPPDVGVLLVGVCCRSGVGRQEK